MMRAGRDYLNRMMTSYRNKRAGKLLKNGLGKPVTAAAKPAEKPALKKR